jgi:phytoene dehydrogenase-like protein
VKASAVPEVVVVGAGVAGLACAADLCAAGLPVRVLEAGDRPGGRMRTDVRDGFRLDRGFQTFNTDYPQVRRRLDVQALDLHEFAAGCLVCTQDGRHLLGDPLHVRGAWREALPGHFASTADLARLAALCAKELVTPASRLKSSTETSALQALEKTGLSKDFIDTALRPFLSGVFLDTELGTSSRVLRLVSRSMLRGKLALPAEGIGAVALQLAGHLPAGTLEFERPVTRLTDEGVLLADGTELPAAHVVVATDPAAAERLLPGVPAVESLPVTTYYHAAPRPPLAEPILLVDARLGVLNTIVVSNALPAAAPPGTALIATSLATAAPPPEATVRGQLAVLYETDTSDWREVAAYRIERALPRMDPPWPLTRPCRIEAGRYLCGDHRATGSLQGAMASGARAAREVLAARG